MDKRARRELATRARAHWEAIAPPGERARLRVGRRDASYALRLGRVRGVVISPVTCRDATDAELRGELRHEHAHLAERWPWPSLLVMAAAGVLTVPFVVVVLGGAPRVGSAIVVAAVFLVAFGALAMATRIKREREYAAHARAAQTPAGHADVIAMLRRLERLWPTPARRSWMTRLMATHPTLRERLARLEERQPPAAPPPGP